MNEAKTAHQVDAQVHLKSRGFTFLWSPVGGSYFWSPNGHKFSALDHQWKDYLVENGFTYSGSER